MLSFTEDFREVIFSLTCCMLSSQLHTPTALNNTVHKAHSYLPFIT